MNTHYIERHFAKIGARVKIHLESRLHRTNGVRLDIGHDGEGEFFEVTMARSPGAELRVVDIQPRLRYLLLMPNQDDGKHKFLCGHDERHWFVAAMPERRSVSSVKSAFEALKPVAV